ncbi:Asp23/Gls24 family envelope stress response protein [Enterococcus sp.]|uniref:Asp23/Gls24 family envelope stress response protein n=1 Tax=Enterococcus sp. TaxID=35783 RepID=UPI0028A075EA|nr:Asp23/Gls24 family envelope stress response protein [Enterococcus sp.]
MSNPNELNNEKPISTHPDPGVPNTTHNPNENSVPMTEAPDPVVPGAQRAADPKPGGPKPGDHPAPGNPKPAGDHPTPPKPGFSGPTGNTPVDGELTYDDKVIQKIIGIALEHVDGLLTVDGGFFSNIAEKLVNTDNVTSGISTEVGKKQVAVDLDIVVEYGRNIPEVAEQVKSVIEKEVTNMTQLEVVEVNINVVDVKTAAEYEEDSETVQDKVSSAASKTGDFASRQTDKAKHAASKASDRIEEYNEPRVK